MAQIASWNGHNFTVSPTLIRSFSGLTITAGSETEEKTSNSQNYVYRKNGAPSEVALTAELNALTGCNVRNEAMAFVTDAHAGAQGYFYVGSKKLLTCQLMLAEAQVSEVVLAANGEWISCKVALTMLQCSKMDGTSGSTSSSSTSSSTSATSSKKTSVKYTDVQPVLSTTGAISGATPGQLVGKIKTDPDTISSVMGWSKTTTSSTPVQSVSAKAAVAATNQTVITPAKAASAQVKSGGFTAAVKMAIGKAKTFVATQMN